MCFIIIFTQFLDINLVSIIINFNFIKKESKQSVRMDQTQEIEKLFVFEKQSTSQSQIVNCIIRTDRRTVQILNALQKISDPAITTFKIYDNENSKFIKLNDILEGQNFRISYHYIQYAPKIFKEKSQKNNNEQTNKKQKNKNMEVESQSSISSSSSVLSQSKKQRSKQRSIGEVIQLVKRWRNIHLGTQQNEKVSLQQAARIVGVSKKTLDDYYYQLRIGQLKKFDFGENMFQGIGVLRNYIKGYRGDPKQNKLYLKHPRQLKIIQKRQLSNSQQLISQPEMPTQKKSQQQIQLDDFLQSNSDQNMLKSYESNFFGQFQLLIEEPNDPFFNYQKSFQKKKDFFNENDMFFDQL